MRATAYESSGDLMSAISDLRVTTKMKSDDTAGILKLSLLQYKLGEAEESLVTIRECLKLDQDHKDCFAHYKMIKRLALLMSKINDLTKTDAYAECVDKANSVLKLETNPAIIRSVKSKKCHCLNKVSQIVVVVFECQISSHDPVCLHRTVTQWTRSLHVQRH
jgi:DnaJ family protein C protein 3